MTLLILIHALIFLAFWLTNLPYQATLNNFLIAATGLRTNFLSIFMVFAGLVALWSTVQLALRRHARRIGPAWPHLAVGVFFLVFFYGSFTVLFLKNPAQLYRVGQMIQYFRLFVDAAILLILSWNLSRWVKVESAAKRALLPAGLLLLWLVPVFWTPGNTHYGALPEKPRLIAHRGATTLAPENTLASMRTAADLGVYGLETDISVSIDGVLFLMHDATMARTTNVARVFLERVNEPAEAFTWNELSILDAGFWFEGSTLPAGDPIPTLGAVLQIVEEKDLHLIFDLRTPSAGHPYADQALDLCLREISAAGVADHTWILAEPDAIARVQSVVPDAILAAGIGYTEIPPSPEFLIADGYRVVNSVYSLSNRMIHAYQNAGLWVNLWLVDETWQYSRLWLAGADSVTTNNIQGLLAMSRPFLALSYGPYLLIWGLVGMVAAAAYWWRTRSGRSPQKVGAGLRSFP